MGKVATTTKMQDGIYTMRYHNTDVVTVDYNTRQITLNTGGYFTATTKKRFNQAMGESALPYQVSSVKGEWFVWNYHTKEDIAKFEGDSVTFNF